LSKVNLSIATKRRSYLHRWEIGVVVEVIVLPQLIFAAKALFGISKNEKIMAIKNNFDLLCIVNHIP